MTTIIMMKLMTTIMKITTKVMTTMMTMTDMHSKVKYPEHERDNNGNEDDNR